MIQTVKLMRKPALTPIVRITGARWVLESNSPRTLCIFVSDRSCERASNVHKFDGWSTKGSHHSYIEQSPRVMTNSDSTSPAISHLLTSVWILPSWKSDPNLQLYNQEFNPYLTLPDQDLFWSSSVSHRQAWSGVGSIAVGPHSFPTRPTCKNFSNIFLLVFPHKNLF